MKKTVFEYTRLATALIIVGLPLGLMQGTYSKKDVIASGKKKDPSFQLVASHFGTFPSGLSWELTVDQDGRGRLTTHPKHAESKVKSIRVTQDKMRRLAMVLEDARFFELPANIGDPIIESDRRRIKLKAGDKEHSVTILFLGGESLEDKEKRDLARRAVRIWSEVRGLFDDGEAFDIRTLEKDLLEKKGG